MRADRAPALRARWTRRRRAGARAGTSRIMNRDRDAGPRPRAPAASRGTSSIVGGGATGVGIAVDAAARGYDVLLLEQRDFGKGTSSRSTKLVHGGVRYLEQGNIALVHGGAARSAACCGRTPRTSCSDLAFVVPATSGGKAPFYGVGLKLYDLLAGRYGFGPSADPLARGDARAASRRSRPTACAAASSTTTASSTTPACSINLVTDRGRAGRRRSLNYAPVTGAHPRRRRAASTASWPRRRDRPRSSRAAARVVDQRRRAVLRRGPAAGRPGRRAAGRPQPGHPPRLRPLLPARRQRDHGAAHDRRPRACSPSPGTATPSSARPTRRSPTCRWSRARSQEEIDFILRNRRPLPAPSPPTRADVLSVFAGIRPLVRSGERTNTAALSRDHTIHIDAAGPAHDHRRQVDDLPEHGRGLRGPGAHARRGFPKRPASRGSCASTATTPGRQVRRPGRLRLGRLLDPGPGSRRARRSKPPLHPALPYCGAEVVWAARYEMARTVEDVLARRTRALFLNARRRSRWRRGWPSCWPRELGRDEAWNDAQVEAFGEVAAGYMIPGTKI